MKFLRRFLHADSLRRADKKETADYADFTDKNRARPLSFRPKWRNPVASPYRFAAGSLDSASLCSGWQSLRVRLQPLQEFWIDLFVSGANERENVHGFGFAFHLYASNRAKVNLIPHKLGGGRTDQNIEAINSSEALDSRREIRRVANDRGIHALVRANIADDHFTVIDANTHAKPHSPFFAPFLIELS